MQSNIYASLSWHFLPFRVCHCIALPISTIGLYSQMCSHLACSISAVCIDILACAQRNRWMTIIKANERKKLTLCAQYCCCSLLLLSGRFSIQVIFLSCCVSVRFACVAFCIVSLFFAILLARILYSTDVPFNFSGCSFQWRKKLFFSLFHSFFSFVVAYVSFFPFCLRICVALRCGGARSAIVPRVNCYR